MNADETQFDVALSLLESAVLASQWQKQPDRGIPALIDEINKKLPADLPSSDEKREKLAKRQANAGVAILRMGLPEKGWPLLRRTYPDDPRVRSYLIHRLGPLGLNAGAVIERMAEEQDVTIRSALLLSLREFSEEQLPADTRNSLLPKLKELYGKENDPGLHAALECLLRQWKMADWLKQVNQAWAQNEKERHQRIDGIQRLVAKDKEKTPPQWYVNSAGQTMVVLPGPVEFLMGSPPTEQGRMDDETPHRRRISRSFAIAAKEVTVEEFLRFRKHHNYYEVYSASIHCPINNVTWYDAAAFCNWLSAQEGISAEQQCYVPNAAGKYAEGMKLAPGYLDRIGYRLPSEAEWEYACRAGALTSRCYGETEELLQEYGWYVKNSQAQGMLPGLPGQWRVKGDCLKPNDFGLFSMLGNAGEWCQERGRPYKPGTGIVLVEDQEDNEVVMDDTKRVLRGGAFFSLAKHLRSASRSSLRPLVGRGDIAFRVARTFR
jgi:formylglycine-generating enzyme required for sulfatase activity